MFVIQGDLQGQKDSLKVKFLKKKKNYKYK